MKQINVVYSQQLSYRIPHTGSSIFLAGPTPRHPEIPSWRPAALCHLSYLEFDGTIFVPEAPGGGIILGYEEQIEWERIHLSAAKCIMFWIPRNMEFLPGFTTNIEFGMWCNSEKIVVGWPSYAQKMQYIKYYVDSLNIPTSNSLEGIVKLAVKMAMK